VRLPSDLRLRRNPSQQVVAASAALTQRCQSVAFSNDESAKLRSELCRLGGSDRPEEALRALQAAGRTDELLQLLNISDQVCEGLPIASLFSNAPIRVQPLAH